MPLKYIWHHEKLSFHPEVHKCSITVLGSTVREVLDSTSQDTSVPTFIRIISTAYTVEPVSLCTHFQ